jgi:hypothetical protein
MAVVRIPAVIALTALAVSLLTGCSAGTPEDKIASPSPSPSNSATVEAPVLLSGVEAVDRYFELAVTSCDAAMATGVVEENASTGDKLIMIPKDAAYKDYSAVWAAADGTSDIIFETDVFLTCADAITFWMLEENGERPTGYEAELSTVGSETVARVTRSLDGDVYTSVYTFVDGKIVSAEIPRWDAPANPLPWSVTYSVGDADRALLEKAVDSFLENNK